MKEERRDCYCPRCKLVHSDLVPLKYDGPVRKMNTKAYLDQRLPVIECDHCFRKRVGQVNYAYYMAVMGRPVKKEE